MVAESVLLTTRQKLGLPIDGDPGIMDDFSVDIIHAINSSLLTLHQLGAFKTKECPTIQDDRTLWTELPIREEIAEFIPVYVYGKVRMIFDPPQTGYLVESIKENLKEMEWRIIAGTETV